MRVNVKEIAYRFLIGKVIVKLNGNDVTKVCFAADDSEGWVGVYGFLENKPGCLLTFGGVSEFILHGEVEIELTPEASKEIQICQIFEWLKGEKEREHVQ